MAKEKNWDITSYQCQVNKRRLMFNNFDIDSRLRISPKSFPDFFAAPVTLYVNDFDEESVVKFKKEMELAQNTNQDIIPIVIDSYGGHVYSLLAMIDIIEQCPVTVATIGLGKMMSCGSVLLTCGDEGYRFASPNSTVMVHDVSSWTSGKNEEIQSSAAQTNKLNKKIFEIMSVNCGHHKSYFLDKLFEKHHAEWYLSSKEAKRENIIQYIKTPSFNISINVNVDFS